MVQTTFGDTVDKEALLNKINEEFEKFILRNNPIFEEEYEIRELCNDILDIIYKEFN